MPTASLTGEGLKRYQRWLAVQRAKGRQPNPSEIQSFLQGEIQANIASDTQRQALGLREEELDIQRQGLAASTEAATRRLELLEKQIDRQSGADTISGITEAIKGVSSLNELTGGAITKGIKYVGGELYDLAGELFDPSVEALDVVDIATDYDAIDADFAGIADEITGVSDAVFNDSFDWTDIGF